MTRKKHKLLSLILVFVMVLSLMPMRAFAAVPTIPGIGEENQQVSTEVVEETEEEIEVPETEEQPVVLKKSARQSQFFNFVTLEELINLINTVNGKDLVFVYVGEDTFEVKGEVEIPSDISLNFNGKALRIDKDAEFTINNWIQCEDLIVDGNMKAYGHINVDGDLEVNGEIYSPEYNISVKYSTEKEIVLDGLDNIVFGDEEDENPWMHVELRGYFETMEELEDLVDAITEDPYRNEERVRYQIQLENRNDEADFNFMLDSDIEVPARTRMEISNADTVTIKEDVSLTNYGELYIGTLLRIEGELANEGQISVIQDEWANGEISLTEGVYSGEGEFSVHTDDTIKDLSKILKGFDLDEMFFELYHDEREGRNHWNLDTSGRFFNTFERLVKLIDSAVVPEGEDWVWITYTGEGTFEIEEDLTIPSYVCLDLRGKDLKIPSGVEVNAEGQINCNDLTVEGTLNAYERFYAEGCVDISGTVYAQRGFRAGTELTVTGNVTVEENSIDIRYPGELNGLDNIQFTEDWQAVVFEVAFEDMEEMAAKATMLATDYIKHERVRYTMRVPGDMNESKPDFVISEDIVIPSYVELQLSGKRNFIIEEGATLTIDGNLYAESPIYLNGAIVNNGDVNVSNRPSEKYNYVCGKIVLGTNGSFTGKGEFRVNTDHNVADIKSILAGFNLDDYDMKEDSWKEGKQWRLSYVGGLKKLGTPINLKWGVEYREQWAWDEEKQMGVIIGWDTLLKPGFMSWETVTPDQARAEIKIYRDGENAPVHVGTWGFNPEQQPQYRSADDFLREDQDHAHKFADGTYYFTVQSLGDGIEYRSSDIADSRDYGEYYTYVSASDKLKTPSGLQWDDRNDEFIRWADWNDKAESEYLDGYWVLFYYSPTKDGDFEQCSGTFSRWEAVSDTPLDNWVIQERGIGYYRFKVKAISNNIEKMSNSDWSDLSPILDVEKISGKVNADLKDIIDDVNQGSAKPDDILKEVQKMDTQDLQAALAADKQNMFATQNLSQLEKMAAGGPAAVQVTPDASAFNTQDVSVIGANLNNKKAGASDIKLVVDKPEKDHVIPERYNSSVAVKFSMNLQNVEDPKHLEVPVKVTLPVPNSINPEFLVIIHYLSDGTHEIIRPHVYWKNNKCYADIVLTSFSDFAMVEEAENQGGSGSGSDSSDDNDDVSVSSKKPTAAAAALPEYVVSGQWTEADGKWMFADKNGAAYKNKWAAVANPYANTAAGQAAFDWFFFDENGQMMTGWVLDGGKWYYLNPASDGTQGRMMIGWQLIDGKWYYLNPVSDGTKGAMAVDTWIDTYYVDKNGVWDETKTK